MTLDKHYPIGIDPASGKATYVWMGSDCTRVKAQEVRSFLESTLQPNSVKYVIAWDAPLAFSEESYSDRVIDRSVRAIIKHMVGIGVVEKKAVNALPFSGLSHWVISCKALGLPFEERLPFCEMATKKTFVASNNHQIVEVHPAVSMAFMWRDEGIKYPFPAYKKSKPARERIVESLGFPKVCVTSDDVLDAYVANLMAQRFIEGNAQYPNDPRDGSYVLPLGDAFNELCNLMDRHH